MITPEIYINNLYSDNGAVANLTVNRLRSDYKKAQKYLNGDQSGIFYIDIHDEQIEFIEASIKPGAPTEQVVNMEGQQLFWADAEGGKMTAEGVDAETGRQRLAVTVYQYDEVNPGGFAFKPVDVNGVTRQTPMLTLGRGDTEGNKVGRIYKEAEALVLEYDHSSGEKYFVRIGEDGITIQPPLNGNSVGDFDSLDITSSQFTITANGSSHIFETPKDTQGRIISVNGGGKNRTVSYS
jgi:hypothetical protein